MNKTKFFLLLPALLLASCGGSGSETSTSTPKTLQSITAEMTHYSHYVGDTIDSSYFSVHASYSDGSYISLDVSKCSIVPSLPYTFTTNDITGGKDFTVTYETKNSTVHANVFENPHKQIDWNTSKVDGTNTLYQLAKKSKNIVFGNVADYAEEIKNIPTTNIYNVQEPESTGGVPLPKIKAYAKDKTSSLIDTLYVLVGGNDSIVFNQNDRVVEADKNYGYFYNCTATEKIVLFKHLRIEDDAKDLSHLFDGCKNLLSVENWRIGVNYTENFEAMYKGCEKIQKVDLTFFANNTGKNYKEMFEGCTNLETIYAENDFVVSTSASSTDMFKDCTSLIGGKGTVYNPEKIDREYAWIDGNEDSSGVTKPGYLTNPRYLYTHYIDSADPGYYTNKETFLTKGENYSVEVSLDSTHSGSHFQVFDSTTAWTPLTFGTDVSLIYIKVNNKDVEYTISSDNKDVILTNPVLEGKLIARFKALDSKKNVASCFTTNGLQ